MSQQRAEPATVSSAIAFGLRATLGVGVFVGLAPAAALAGHWLLPALVLAALVAACGAYGTAELARAYPEPGGGYVYVREQFGRWPGRMAASAGLVGKAAVAAAVAGTFGTTVLPDRPAVAALGAIAVASTVNIAGIPVGGRTAWVLAGTVIAVLGLVVAACFAIAPPPVAVPLPHSAPGSDFPVGALAASGVLFVSFAGFEWITAPGDGEPRYSPRQLRVAIPVVVLIALAVSMSVSAAVVRQLGLARLALSSAPLHDALVAADAAALTRFADLGTAVAMLSVLVVLLAEMRHPVLALARDGDLPASVALPGRWATPWRANVLCALSVAGVMFALSPVAALELCAGCLLAYYGLTHAAARGLVDEERRWPLCVACVGLSLSVIIGISLPVPVLVATGIVLFVGPCLAALISRRWR